MFIANWHVAHHTTPTESNMDMDVTIPINIQSIQDWLFNKRAILSIFFVH